MTIASYIYLWDWPKSRCIFMATSIYVSLKCWILSLDVSKLEAFDWGMFENVVAIKINILIVWSWPTMKIVDWQLFKAHKWVTASAREQPGLARWGEVRRGRGEVCWANSWRPVMWTLKIFDSIWPQEGLCYQATFIFIFNWLFLSLRTELWMLFLPSLHI